MGEFRASEADIKIFILEALQTILKTGGDIQEKPQRFFLNSKERFLIDTTNIDEYFTNTRYWNDSKLISPDNDQEKQEAYLMIKHLVPIVRSRTLRELNKVINENHYQPFIDDGLSIMMTPYSDFAFKEKEKAGFLAQLKTDYSDGGRFNSYEIAVYVTHIQDVKRWLWGRYMPEESTDQPQKQLTTADQTPKTEEFYTKLFDDYFEVASDEERIHYELKEPGEHKGRGDKSQRALLKRVYKWKYGKDIIEGQLSTLEKYFRVYKKNRIG